MLLIVFLFDEYLILFDEYFKFFFFVLLKGEERKKKDFKLLDVKSCFFNF